MRSLAEIATVDISSAEMSISSSTVSEDILPLRGTGEGTGSSARTVVARPEHRSAVGEETHLVRLTGQVVAVVGVRHGDQGERSLADRP